MDKLEQMLQSAIENAIAEGYDIGNVSIKAKPIPGVKVGYAGGTEPGKKVKGYIVIDNRYADYGEAHEAELFNTILHELAHLIAETLKSPRKKKPIWHGDSWKEIHLGLGGTGERYYSGEFVKPENNGKVFKTMAELYKTLPTQPATDWERGTFRQWLERGYHVMKGEKGQFVTWEFSSEEYETKDDGKTSSWGHASACYFTPEQVEANQPKGDN